MKRTIPVCAALAALATIAVAVGVGPAYADDLPAQASESITDYFVEDAAPALVAGGLQFDGTSAGGQAVDAYHSEDVALASVTELGYTIATAPADGQGDPAYALEVYTDGTPAGYTTLSAEPYQNGLELNAAGAFDVTSWKFWSSHIAADADGGQGNPEPLSWFEGQYPQARVVSHGVHLGSAEVDSTAVVVSTSFDGATTDFTHGTQAAPVVVSTAPAGATAAGAPTVTGIDPQSGLGTQDQSYTASSALGTVYYDVQTPNTKDPQAVAGLAAPVVTQPQGAKVAQNGTFVWHESAQGTVTLAAAAGGSWSIDGAAAGAGTAIPLKDGPHTVTFTADEGRLIYPADVPATGIRAGDVVTFAVTLKPGTASGAAKVTVSKAPWITGTAQIGKPLTANLGTVSPVGAKVAYQWHLNGAVITSGGTGKTFTPASAGYLGKKLSVRITVTSPGYTSYAATSSQSAAIKVGSLTAPTPTISGTTAVGKSLTAKPGAWTAGTTLHYQWYAAGKALSGQTHATLALGSAEYGKVVAVKVTGSKSGYTTVARTSTSTAKVAKGTLTGATPKFSISSSYSGYPLVGATLKASAGAWTSGTALHYQWYAGGSAISGATASSYKVPASLVGKTLNLRIVGTKSYYNSLTKYSGPSAPVIQTKAYYLAHSGNKTTYKVQFSGLESSSGAGVFGIPSMVGVIYASYPSFTVQELDVPEGATSYTTSLTLPNAPAGTPIIAAGGDPGMSSNGVDAHGTVRIYAKPAGAPDVYYTLAVQQTGTEDIYVEIDGK